MVLSELDQTSSNLSKDDLVFKKKDVFVQTCPLFCLNLPENSPDWISFLFWLDPC